MVGCSAPSTFSPIASARCKSGSAKSGASEESAAVLARHILPRYESALRACNAIDFDDLLALTLKLFEDHPKIPYVARAHASQATTAKPTSTMPVTDPRNAVSRT